MTAQPSRTSRRCSLFSISTSSYRWPTIYRYANFSDRSSYRGSEERTPGTRVEAAIRCYRRGRRLPLLWKKLRCTLVGIREKIMAIYYPEDWRSMLLTLLLASKVAMARGSSILRKTILSLSLFLSVHLLVYVKNPFEYINYVISLSLFLNISPVIGFISRATNQAQRNS